MIVKGSFDPESGRPYVQGLLFIPSWNKRSPIDFLVDTGADVTTLNPGDGRRMGSDYGSLAYTEPRIGVGSHHNAAVERAIVVFASEDGTLPVYLIRLSITPYSLEMEPLPSLLGTDILRRWRIYWDPSQDRLDFEVISADAILPEGLFR